MYYINKAFDKTVDATRFHPFFGHCWDFEEKELKRKHQELVDLAEREPVTVTDERRNFETLKRIDQAIIDAFTSTAAAEEEPSVLVMSPEPIESQPMITVTASTLRADSIVALANDEVSQQSSSSATGKKKRRREASLGGATGTSKKKEKPT